MHVSFLGCNFEAVPLKCNQWFQAVHNISQTSGACESIATSGSLWLVMWIPVCTRITKILGEQNVRCEEYFGSGPGWERVRAYRNTAEVSAHQFLQDTGQ